MARRLAGDEDPARPGVQGCCLSLSHGYVGRVDGTTNARDDSFVDFQVDVPTAGTYTMAIKYANGTGATSTQGLAYNGGAWSTISYLATAGWGQFTDSVSATLTLYAGFNTIRLAKSAPFYAGGTGYAELDSTTLTQ
ncbi:CBM35 domain-containing protein [Arthrobacter sp. efr-133-TYG-118]|uniref:CBM35 domain-containing protein n=1 Tax=Arthrobacter sp. efr-133-TYG-118 TaxID=3040279 RepID=UPI00254B8567|nr:CBM35 domain-containing protein [Arthrobacter sp. efr-133-TYG-118]